MRLDKLIAQSGLLSRKEVQDAIRRGLVTVDGHPAKSKEQQVSPDASVLLGGVPVVYREQIWVMLNKPLGYVSATEDGRYPVVTELLPPEYRKRGMFPVGRLDRDTLGLMLLTDDGNLAHLLLSPKRHVEKCYRFRVSKPLPPDAEALCLAGLELGDFVAKPAVLSMDPSRTSGTVTLTEGKYHEIKRMMHRLGSEITYLERIRFARISLDPSLARGEWRDLTEEEILSLKEALPKQNSNAT